MHEEIALPTNVSGTGGCHQRPSGRSSLLRRVLVVPLLLGAAVMLAACSASPSASQPATDADPMIQTCTPDVAEAAFSVVTRQASAFANDDFDAALQFASKGFRSTVTLPRFKALIVSGYNFLLVSPKLRLTDCSTEGTVTLLRVGASSNVALEYRMVAEDGQWRIDSASILKEIAA